VIDLPVAFSQLLTKIGAFLRSGGVGLQKLCDLNQVLSRPEFSIER